ncbi:MAG: pitrilysin family protein [Armatimonadota bacterium]
MNIKNTNLSNGLTVITCPQKETGKITLCGLIKAGSIYDPGDKHGLSNITARMISSSLASYAEKYKKIKAGLKFTLHDSNYYTENIRFEITANPRDLAAFLNIFCHYLINPDFGKEDFSKIKGEIKDELSEKINTVEFKKQNIIYNQNYPENHPYNHYYMGNEESLENISFEDVVNFYKTHYIPNNTIIGITEPVKAENTENLLKQYLGNWKKCKDINLSFPPFKENKRNVAILAGELEEGSYAMILSTPTISRTSPDYYALNILNYTLGANPYENKLMDNLLKEGADYAFSVFPPALAASCWQINISFNTPDKLDKVIETVNKVLLKISSEELSDEELKRTKNYFTERFPLLMEMPGNLALMLALTEYYGLGTDYFDKYKTYYTAVSGGNIQTLARKYLNPDTLNILIIKED